MSATVIAFFNNKGGVGKTSLVYHLAWMYADLGKRVVAALKPYRSLMPMAQEARKPMLYLKPADGAIGAHLQAVQAAYRDFQQMARAVAEKTGVLLPRSP